MPRGHSTVNHFWIPGPLPFPGRFLGHRQGNGRRVYSVGVSKHQLEQVSSHFWTYIYIYITNIYIYNDICFDPESRCIPSEHPTEPQVEAPQQKSLSQGGTASYDSGGIRGIGGQSIGISWLPAVFDHKKKMEIIILYDVLLAHTVYMCIIYSYN